jgi:predicted permease
MIVMGMRLATSDIKSLFTNKKIYLAVFVKQIIMPLIAFVTVIILPIDIDIKKTFLILTACPVASVVLNYSEIVGKSQKEGANAVLLGTIFSILTLPVIVLLLPLLG